MSLWWTQREQLDKDQVELIESLPLREHHLVCGPPGSGKTNVLLRRAQFVRSQDMPNVLVLTFTRSLVEFVRTGCIDSQAREIFPRACVDTLESWIRRLYRMHERELPPQADLSQPNGYRKWKSDLAAGALDFIKLKRVPRYDALFVDEVQDLYATEVELLKQWGKVLFFVGDSRQKIFDGTTGLEDARKIVGADNERTLKFHYRLAPEICKMADRMLQATGADSLSQTCHYKGPKPGRIRVDGPWERANQLKECASRLKNQIRVYGDFIKSGDRLGVVVARKNDRDEALEYLESDAELRGLAKIIRARDGSDEDMDYDPTFDPDHPICILTVKGCKGIEFRSLHWLFAEQLSKYHSLEHYYTLATRPKTSLDITYDGHLPQDIARSYAPSGEPLW